MLRALRNEVQLIFLQISSKSLAFSVQKAKTNNFPLSQPNPNSTVPLLWGTEKPSRLLELLVQGLELLAPPGVARRPGLLSSSFF